MAMLLIDAQIICDLRQALGLTADAFAKRLGVTQNTVFRWESGLRTPGREHQVAINHLLREAEKKGLFQFA